VISNQIKVAKHTWNPCCHQAAEAGRSWPGRSWQKLAEAGLAETGRSWQKLSEAVRSWQKLAEAGRSWQKLAADLSSHSQDDSCIFSISSHDCKCCRRVKMVFEQKKKFFF
jgi:hypothetical protein